MQPYRGYFIEGTALLVHPFSPDWHVCGGVLVTGRQGSIVELARFRLQNFTVSMILPRLPNTSGFRSETAGLSMTKRDKYVTDCHAAWPNYSCKRPIFLM